MLTGLFYFINYVIIIFVDFNIGQELISYWYELIFYDSGPLNAKLVCTIGC